MPGADKPVTLSLVEDAVLYSGYTEGWSTRRRGVLEAALRRQDWFHPDTGRRGRIGESDVTALLSAAEGDLETALVEFFLGDLPSSDGGTVRVLSGSQVRKRYRRKGDHRVPDMFVARVADDDAIQPLVLIEAKGRAWVNGGRGYCAKDAEKYSNQAICYPHLCWPMSRSRTTGRNLRSSGSAIAPTRPARNLGVTVVSPTPTRPATRAPSPRRWKSSGRAQPAGSPGPGRTWSTTSWTALLPGRRRHGRSPASPTSSGGGRGSSHRPRHRSP